MPHGELNLAGLRNGRLPRLLSPPTHSRVSPVTWDELALTRRDLFGVAAFAGIGLSPALKAVGTILAAADDSLSSEVGETRIVFRLNGLACWVIDTRDFGGRPRLGSTRRPGYWRIELTGATFPGTRLPADFVCELHQRSFSWAMRIAFTLGSFHSRVPFERWLTGAEVARSAVRLDQPVCELGMGGRFTVSGTGTAQFTPDWRFLLSGASLARFDGPDGGLVSDTVRLALLDPAQPSLVAQPGPRRTLLALERGRRTWTFSPAFPLEGQSHLVCPPNAFSLLHLEVWDDGPGRPAGAVLIEAERGGPRIWFHPVTADEDALAEPLGLPLAGARYARVFDPAGGRAQRAVLAQFDPTPVWLALHGCRLEIGPSPGTPPFELVQRQDDTSLCCEPAIRRIAVPLAGAIVEPIEVPAGARLRLVQSPLRKPGPGIQQQAPIVVPPAQQPAPAPPVKSPILEGPPTSVAAMVLSDFRSLLQVQGPLTVSVVRAEDLLVLKFELRHLTLQVGPGQPPSLVRTAGAPRPIIVVHFPPQHIAEQAFFESASGGAAVKFPLAAQISGPSRLVFEAPDELPVIPYTLEALLDWSRFLPVVARAAEPPPAPSSTSLLLRPWRELTPFMKEGMVPQVVPRGVPFQAVPRRKESDLQQVPPQAQAPPAAVQPFRPGLESPAALLAPPAPPKKEELPNLTAIEAPYRLFLSPSRMAGWAHAQRPATLAGRTELWHTRLGVRRQDGQGRWWVDESDWWYRTLRAIWSPDYADDIALTAPPKPDPFVTAPKPDPFVMALKALDRHQLVHLMAEARLDPAGWPARVARADRFMLSALGAWISLRYAAERVAPIDLVGWCHNATMGRDHYVRVARLGYLFPLGHKALLVTVTERKFEKVGGDIVAVLRQRQFIEVREAVKSYPAPGQQSAPSQGRAFPFTSVRLLTQVTPALDLPTPTPAVPAGLTLEQGLWPYVGGLPFPFQTVAEDHAGQAAEFAMPLLFLMASSAENPAIVQRVLDADGPGPLKGYADDQARRNVASVLGQKVAFAPSRPSGETILETGDLAFGAEMPSPQVAAGLTNVQPAFYPTVERAGVRVPAVQHLLGNSSPVMIRYAPVYKALGFNPNGNAGEVFAELAAPLSLEFYADKTGGLATPYLDIRGLSRRWGPVGGNLDSVAKGVFVPTDYFRKAANPNDPAQRAKQANLLGSLYLGDVVTAGPPPAMKARFMRPPGQSRRRRALWHLVNRDGKNDAVPVAGPPGFQAEPRPPENPNRLWISFHFETEDLKPDPLKLFLPWLGDNPQAEGCCRGKLTLHSRTKIGLSRPGQPPPEGGTSARGVLTNFQLNFFKLVIISFRELRYAVRSDGQPELGIRLDDQDPVRFGGALKFVDGLRRFLTAEVFARMPNVLGMAASQGARAERSLALPNLSLGMFNMSNVALKCWVELPYNNQPVSFVFSFGSPGDPAGLAVGPFGGGFCLVVAMSGYGIQRIEAWFVFGGKGSLDIGLASGGVCVECGIHYGLVTNPAGEQQFTLGGLYRISGLLSILGIVSAAVEFKLALEYNAAENKLYGEAVLIVKIELLFTSESVTLRVGKELPGSPVLAAIPNDLVHLAGLGRPRRTQGPGIAVPRPRAPHIVDLWSESDWVQYSAAFAAT